MPLAPAWRLSLFEPAFGVGSSMRAQGDLHVERRAARLAAVQAIYQMELTGEDAKSVTQEFCDHRFGEMAQECEPDRPFFCDLVRGVRHHQVEIDHAIGEGLSAGWTLHRIDSIL